MRNKIISLILIALFMIPLASCKANINNEIAREESNRISVVTTVFPIYDWVVNVVGTDRDNVDITMLLDSGVDLHSFQPTVEDISRITDCDVFIYVGGESDEWVDDALKESANDNLVVVNLIDELGAEAVEEETVPGMQADDEEDNEGGGDEEDDAEYDEHIWLSLKNADILTEVIAGALSEARPESSEIYKENAESYKEKLEALDVEYRKVVETAKVKTLLFGDRFPFRYMTDDYGLDYYAAFSGCSAETEASFETVAFLAEKVDELSLKHVMTIEGSNHKIAESIVSNTKDKYQDILVLDSMQSINGNDVMDGANYLDIMKSNLEVLKIALS